MLVSYYSLPLSPLANYYHFRNIELEFPNAETPRALSAVPSFEAREDGARVNYGY